MGVFPPPPPTDVEMSLMAEYSELTNYDDASDELTHIADIELDGYQMSYDDTVTEIKWMDDEDIWHCVQLLNLGEKMRLQLTWWVEMDPGVRLRNVPFSDVEVLENGQKHFYRDETVIADDAITNTELRDTIRASDQFPALEP